MPKSLASRRGAHRYGQAEGPLHPERPLDVREPSAPRDYERVAARASASRSLPLRVRETVRRLLRTHGNQCRLRERTDAVGDHGRGDGAGVIVKRRPRRRPLMTAAAGLRRADPRPGAPPCRGESCGRVTPAE
jgi:hypothetical protein